MIGKESIKRFINLDYKEEMTKKRNYKYIRKFFDIREKGEYTIDDSTWDDLDMNNVYAKLDRNYSSPGEAVLYYMLRNPLMNEEKLKQRDSIVNYLTDNKSLRTDLQCIYYKLSRDMKNGFLEMVEDEPIINKGKYYFYTLLGKVLPVLLILMAIILKNPQYILGLFFLSCINMYINSKERETVKSQGILYLRDIINASKKISIIKDEKLGTYINEIKDLLKDMKGIDYSTRAISIANMWGGLLDFMSVIFLLEECAYYKIGIMLKEKRESLFKLYYLIGEIEALISITSYKAGLEVKWSKPKFQKDISLNIVNGVHPLIKKAVSNTINMKKRGMVLTGTNMSGKSTFLRMLGINMIFSQTFYFVLAEEYKCSFFNIVSSISPNDDISKGKSFYMAEAESLLRIINALNKEMPVFCPIDEIFRGTNPVERISASAAILNYINERKSISIVATHDRELVDILKNNYEFYYFSETVDQKKGLGFDYKIKKGVSKTRNAIKLLDYIGYPKEIIQKAYKRAETIEGFI